MIDEKTLWLIGNDLVNELVLACPVDTGRLKNSISFNVKDEDTIEISMASYGEAVEFGTLPHIIRPKSKKALKFKSGGETVFAKKVNHPGTQPQPFIRRTLQLKLPRILKNRLSG